MKVINFTDARILNFNFLDAYTKIFYDLKISVKGKIKHEKPLFHQTRQILKNHFKIRLT